LLHLKNLRPAVRLMPDKTLSIANSKKACIQYAVRRAFSVAAKCRCSAVQ
jgi:hypothetical protein